MKHAVTRAPASTNELVAHWLRTRAILFDGDRDGAVVAWREPDGTWNACYPEVAGYYLSFLANCFEAESRGLARRVIAWLDRVSVAGPPLTRDYPQPGIADWRNLAVFSFDLAMILRGLCAIAAADPAVARHDLVDRYGAMLVEIEDDGLIASHRPRGCAPMDCLPKRWSTVPGVHHLKVAAALDMWKNDRAKELAARTVDVWTAELPGIVSAGDIQHAHPFLYGVEGALILWGRHGTSAHLEAAQKAFLALVEKFGLTADEDLGRAAGADVLAQIWRAGIALENAGVICGAQWSAVRRRVAGLLGQRVDAEGGVVFDEATAHRNVWAGIFTWQAFTARAALTEPRAFAASLI